MKTIVDAVTVLLVCQMYGVNIDIAPANEIKCGAYAVEKPQPRGQSELVFGS
jgi:hypothetical protein